MIPQADFARLVRLVEPIVAKMKPTPTYFDVLTAIAFKYFAEQKVEIAVVETGLGGRLDSTNVLKPEVTAITSISKDHMAQLGRHGRQDRRGEGRHLQDRRPRGHRAAGAGGRSGAEAGRRRQSARTLDVTGKTIEFSYRFESSRMLGPAQPDLPVRRRTASSSTWPSR